MGSSYAVEVENLYKSYGRLPALHDLTLQIQKGEVYGLFGPHGSGKSTLIHILMGLLKPSAGSVRVLGMPNIQAVRGRVGYVPERLRYHLRYTAREYLHFLGQFGDISHKRLRQRIDDTLADVGLSYAANRPLGTFSSGMLQLFGIAQALLHNPDLILIDEPTGGLEPVFRYEVLDMLSRIHAQVYTVVISTRYPEVIEQICDRVGILSHGRLLVEVDANQIRSPGANVKIQVSYLKPEIQVQLKRLSPDIHCSDYMIILRPNSEALQMAVLQTLLEAQVSVLALEPLERMLDHVYLEVMRTTSLGVRQQVSPTFTPLANTVERHLSRSAERDVLLKELLQGQSNATDGGQGIEARERGTEVRERELGNGSQELGNGEQGSGDRGQESVNKGQV